MFIRFKRGALACALLVSSTLAIGAAVSTVTPPNLGGGLAGTIPGQASVSSRGASQYSFPIAVPPGTAGMAPSLGMSYDSENPLDISGLGWSLNGMSTITRCKRTLATDGLVHPVDLTAADAYCLNGERLIKISGTDGAAAEYRTEVESFQRVKSFGTNTAMGPDHWTVETRDGRVLTIGGLQNATVVRGVNWVWTLQRVQDQHGNYMTYSYELSSTGEYFPIQILYTGNAAAGLVPYNSVDFVYEARNDVFSGRVADVLVKRPNRLKQIRTRIGVAADGTGGSVVRQWNFAYTYSPYSNRSLLQSVTDCNGDASQCLPATTFAWTQRDPSKNTSAAPGSGVWAHGPGIALNLSYGDGTYLAPAQLRARAVVGDFNGDGKQDLLTNPSGSSTWSLCPSTGTDFACVSLPGMPAVSSESFHVGDFNGDGLTDVLVDMGTGQQWSLCLATGTGFTCTRTTGMPTGGNGNQQSVLNPIVADFSGDGRDDIMFKGTLCTSTGNAFTCAAYSDVVYGMWDTVPANPDEYFLAGSHTLGDFDGDGRIDILTMQSFAGNDGYCTTSPVNNCHINGTEFYRYIVGQTGLVQASYGGGAGVAGGGSGDINGDGVADLVFRATVIRHTGVNTWGPTYHYITTCIGGTQCSSVPFQPTDWTANFVGYGDSLQSGAPVAMYMPAGAAYVAPMNVDGSLVAAQNTTMPWTPITDSALSVGSIVMDVTGDGPGASLFYTPTGYTATSTGPSTTGTWKAWLTGAGSFPDRLQSVTDGNGLTTRWTYVSGNDSTVVSAGARLAYPTKNVHLTTPVVSKMSVDADSAQTAGKTLDTTYTYSGMRMDLRGRGSLGFDTVKSTEVVTDPATGMPTGVVTTTQYSQTFPTIAQTTSVTKVAGGVTVHSAVSTWAWVGTQSGLNVLYPYVRARVTTGQDLDGTWLPRTYMQVGTAGGIDGIDAYGNLTNVTTNTAENNNAGDGYQVIQQCTDFDNRIAAQWVLGLCRMAYQSALSPSSTAFARQLSSTFDSFGALQASTSMPGTPLALTTTYTPDPNTGMPIVVTQAWTDPLDGLARSRATTMTYDSAWRFPVTIKNALLQVVTLGYDAATGAKISQIDFNNLTTNWKVDAWGRTTEEDRPDGTYTTLSYRKCVDSCGALATHVDVAQHWAPGSAQMLAPEETLYDSRARKLLYRTWNDANTEADTTWTYGDMGDLYTQTLPKYTSDASTGTTTNSLIDVLHRPKRVDRTNAQGSGVDSTSYAYSALTTTTIDANLHTRVALLNALGKVKKVTDNNGQAVTYAYDGFGDLLSTTDPVGNIVSMGYDMMGHKTSMKDPDLGSWTYVVDAVGRTRKQTDAKNQVATYVYDLLDRLTQRVEADQESDWLFDTAANGVGELTEAYTKNQSGTRDYDRVHQYDMLGREKQVTLSLDWDYTTLTTYNAYGMPATVTHRRNVIGQTDSTAQIVHTLDYNVRGAVKAIQRDGATVWTLNYDDAAGRKRQETLGNGLVVEHGYNPFTAFLTSINAGTDNGAHGATPTMQGDVYTYDPVGNLQTRSNWADNGGTLMTETFGYDALDRLLNSAVTGQPVQTFGYDALGDMSAKTGIGTYNYPVAGGVRPHLVSTISGSVAGLTNPSFSYDANGNLQNGLNRYYTWTASNLPATIDRLTGSGVAAGTYPQSSNLRYTFSYGPDRDRTKQTIQVVSGGAPTSMNSQMITAEGIEKEIDFLHNVTKIRTYLPGGVGFSEEDIAGTAVAANATGTRSEFYFLKDNLGSPEVVVDQSKVVKQRMAYDAWGRRRTLWGSENAWSSVDQSGLANQEDHKGYTDQEELDELSLVHLNGRVYDPMTSRFVSPDPTIPDPYDLQSLNRASYVRNSPLDKVDPTGFDDLCKDGCTVKITTKTAAVTGSRLGTTNTQEYKIGAQGVTESFNGSKPEPMKLNSNQAVPTAPAAKSGLGACGQCNRAGNSGALGNLLAAFFGPVAEKIDEFNNSDAGRAAQGIPEEPLLAGAMAGASRMLGKLGRVEKVAEEGADMVVHGHHPFPQYLGGKFEQLLELLPKEIHDSYHSGLDKILPRQIRGGATDFYASLSSAERAVNMQKLETYTRKFDQMHGTHLWEAAVREGATGVPTR